MNAPLAWAALGITLVAIVGYEAWLAWAAGRVPRRLSQSAHALLREEWFAAVGAQNASEVLAVQTLRNALTSATMTVSTAALALMGTLALTALCLHSSLDVGSTAAMPPRVALELALLASLLGSLFASTMAVRYYNHAGFIRAIPVESEARAMERHGQCVRAPGRSTVPLGFAPAHPRGARDDRARAAAGRALAALLVVALPLLLDHADDTESAARHR